MIRTTFLAFVTLFLPAVLVAEEPTADLEDIAVQIMLNAFDLGDYDTAETLFDKVSPKNKKMFLQAVITTMSLTESKQTQLLGRLTLSLFEQAERCALSSTELLTSPRPYIFTTQEDKGIRAQHSGDSMLLRAHLPAVPLQALERAKGEMTIKIYYVGDILKPGSSIDLFGIITTVIDPDSWGYNEKGGNGVIEMHPATQSLAIRQTEDVHAQIADLLEQIRKIHEQPREVMTGKGWEVLPYQSSHPQMQMR